MKTDSNIYALLEGVNEFCVCLPCVLPDVKFGIEDGYMLLGSGEFHENRCSEAIHEGHKLHSACIFYMFNLLLKKKMVHDCESLENWYSESLVT